MRGEIKPRRCLLWLAVSPILLFVCAVDLNSPEFRAAETEVIRDIQRIHQAETQYLSRYERHATSLGELTALDDVTPGEKYGYLFSLAGALNGYEVRATPKVFGRAGRRTFYSNETLTIRQNWGPESAGPQSAEFEVTPRLCHVWRHN